MGRGYGYKICGNCVHNSYIHKYHITPLGEKLLKYGTITLNNFVPDWEEQLEKFYQSLKENTREPNKLMIEIHGEQ